MRRWRKMTWAIIVWCALILVWAIAGGGSAANDCAKQADKLSHDACQTGAGIGIALVLLIGFFGFVFLSLIWFMTRPRTRPCPRCGEDVKKGVMRCGSCGFDFAEMGQPVAQ
jgi:Na+/proline symporter